MFRRLSIAVLITTICGLSCKDDNPLTAARDLTGQWVGNGPNGAFYQDNVANPNCRYEADLIINLTQNGNDLGGSFTLTVRKSEKLLSTSVSCAPVGSRVSRLLAGQVSGSSVSFHSTSSTEVSEFSGTFTSNIMSGDFEVGGFAPLIGTFRVTR